MPDQLMIALVGLSGALVGAAASVGAIWVQSYYQHKRDRTRIVTDLAVHAHQQEIAFAKENKGALVFPISLHLHQQAEHLRILERRPLEPSDLKRIRDESERLAEAIDDHGFLKR